MSFSETIARRLTGQIRRFSRTSTGQIPRIFFPAVPNARQPGAYPHSLECQIGTGTQSDRDLLTGLDRRVRTFAVSFVTSSLPTAFRNSMGGDTIQKEQVVKVGFLLATATTYKVTASSSASGITTLDLTQQL